MVKKDQKLTEVGEEISFKYTYADYFRNYYANGIWGGINPHGEIIMNFYLEKNKPPEETKHRLTEANTLEEISRKPKEQLIVRELQAGIVLNLNVARSIRDWLDDKIKSMETVLEEAKTERKK